MCTEKLNPGIVVMQCAEDGERFDVSGPLNRSLSEILLEKRKRSPSVFGVREVAAKIVELSGASPDGLTARPYVP